MKKNSRFAGFYMGLIFFLMYLPIAVVIVFSFNESKLPVKFTGFSLKWYQELFHDRAMLEALVNSLILGVLSCLVSAVIGTLGAVGLSRIHWKSKGALEYISILPLMIPEIILGMVLMAFFYMLNLPFGMLTLLIGHTVFCVPYILMEVKARLAGMDPALEEAARDLAVRVQDLDVKIVSQMGGLIELARMEESDILVTAIVGMIGIRPTMEAILAGKDIALANKETLVTAGHLIMPLAKQFGVQTGEAIWQARQKCPDLICVPPDYALYIRFSRRMRRLYEEYSDHVESFGLDEAWIDLTNPGLTIRDGERIAHEIQLRVKRELGITVSVGVSFNKIFAKLGSDYKKPDATTVISRENWRSIVWPLPVGDLLYVGGAVQKLLGQYGVKTIGQLAACKKETLETLMGKMGTQLYEYANGLDSAPVRARLDAEPVLSLIHI